MAVIRNLELGILCVSCARFRVRAVIGRTTRRRSSNGDGHVSE